MPQPLFLSVTDDRLAVSCSSPAARSFVPTDRRASIESLEARRLLTSAVISLLDGGGLGTVPALSVFPGTAVHVHALDSTLTAGDRLEATYEWDFGDPYWRKPGPVWDLHEQEYLTGNRNELRGWKAAHVYDVPGQYQMKLRVTDAAGTVSVATAEVLVRQETRPAVYVASDGAGSGANPSSPVDLAGLRQLLDGYRAAGSDFGGARILFSAGDQFDLVTPLDLRSLSDVTVGAWGSGPMPFLNWDVPGGAPGHFTATMLHTSSTTRNLTIQDLRIGRADYVPGRWEAVGVMRPEGVNTTFRGVHVEQVLDFVVADGPASRGVLLLDNIAPRVTDIRSYFAWVQSPDIAILGNYAAGSVHEHVVRGHEYQRILISHNAFANPNHPDSINAAGQIKSGSAINLQAGPTGGFEVHAWVASNFIHGASVFFGPLLGADGLPGQWTRWGVFEDNLITNEPHPELAIPTGGLNVTQGGQHVVFRNNIVDMSPLWQGSGISVWGFDESKGQGSKDVRLLFNTVRMRENTHWGIHLHGGPATADWGGNTVIGNLVTVEGPPHPTRRALEITGEPSKALAAAGQNHLGGSPYAVLHMKDGGGTWYGSASEWNDELQQSGIDPRGDVFADTFLGPDYRPASASSEIVTPRPDARTDFFGRNRPISQFNTAGAVERNPVDDENQLVVIDFEHISGPGLIAYYGDWYHDPTGFSFRNPSAPAHDFEEADDIPGGIWAQRVMESMMIRPTDAGGVIQLRQTNNQPFALDSFEITDARVSTTIQVTGHRTDGTTLTETFTLNVTREQRTIAAHLDWTDLQSVTIRAQGHYAWLDNFSLRV